VSEGSVLIQQSGDFVLRHSEHRLVCNVVRGVAQFDEYNNSHNVLYTEYLDRSTASGSKCSAGFRSLNGRLDTMELVGSHYIQRRLEGSSRYISVRELQTLAIHLSPKDPERS
jgi:hypothetical protein